MVGRSVSPKTASRHVDSRLISKACVSPRPQSGPTAQRPHREVSLRASPPTTARSRIGGGVPIKSGPCPLVPAGVFAAHKARDSSARRHAPATDLLMKADRCNVIRRTNSIIRVSPPLFTIYLLESAFIHLTPPFLPINYVSRSGATPGAELPAKPVTTLPERCRLPS
jgi:hypothetical protein